MTLAPRRAASWMAMVPESARAAPDEDDIVLAHVVRRPGAEHAVGSRANERGGGSLFQVRWGALGMHWWACTRGNWEKEPQFVS